MTDPVRYTWNPADIVDNIELFDIDGDPVIKSVKGHAAQVLHPGMQIYAVTYTMPESVRAFRCGPTPLHTSMSTVKMSSRKVMDLLQNSNHYSRFSVSVVAGNGPPASADFIEREGMHTTVPSDGYLWIEPPPDRNTKKYHRASHGQEVLGNIVRSEFAPSSLLTSNKEVEFKTGGEGFRGKGGLVDGVYPRGKVEATLRPIEHHPGTDHEPPRLDNIHHYWNPEVCSFTTIQAEGPTPYFLNGGIDFPPSNDNVFSPSRLVETTLFRLTSRDRPDLSLDLRMFCVQGAAIWKKVLRKIVLEVTSPIEDMEYYTHGIGLLPEQHDNPLNRVGSIREQVLQAIDKKRGGIELYNARYRQMLGGIEFSDLESRPFNDPIEAQHLIEDIKRFCRLSISTEKLKLEQVRARIMEGIARVELPCTTRFIVLGRKIAEEYSGEDQGQPLDTLDVDLQNKNEISKALSYVYTVDNDGEHSYKDQQSGLSVRTRKHCLSEYHARWSREVSETCVREGADPEDAAWTCGEIVCEQFPNLVEPKYVQMVVQKAQVVIVREALRQRKNKTGSVWEKCKYAMDACWNMCDNIVFKLLLGITAATVLNREKSVSKQQIIEEAISVGEYVIGRATTEHEQLRSMTKTDELDLLSQRDLKWKSSFSKVTVRMSQEMETLRAITNTFCNVILGPPSEAHITRQRTSGDLKTKQSFEDVFESQGLKEDPQRIERLTTILNDIATDLNFALEDNHHNRSSVSCVEQHTLWKVHCIPKKSSCFLNLTYPSADSNDKGSIPFKTQSRVAALWETLERDKKELKCLIQLLKDAEANDVETQKVVGTPSDALNTTLSQWLIGVVSLLAAETKKNDDRCDEMVNTRKTSDDKSGDNAENKSGDSQAQKVQKVFRPKNSIESTIDFIVSREPYTDQIAKIIQRTHAKPDPTEMDEVINMLKQSILDMIRDIDIQSASNITLESAFEEGLREFPLVLNSHSTTPEDVSTFVKRVLKIYVGEETQKSEALPDSRRSGLFKRTTTIHKSRQWRRSQQQGELDVSTQWNALCYIVGGVLSDMLVTNESWKYCDDPELKCTETDIGNITVTVLIKRCQVILQKLEDLCKDKTDNLRQKTLEELIKELSEDYRPDKYNNRQAMLTALMNIGASFDQAVHYVNYAFTLDTQQESSRTQLLQMRGGRNHRMGRGSKEVGGPREMRKKLKQSLSPLTSYLHTSATTKHPLNYWCEPNILVTGYERLFGDVDSGVSFYYGKGSNGPVCERESRLRGMIMNTPPPKSQTVYWINKVLKHHGVQSYVDKYLCNGSRNAGKVVDPLSGTDGQSSGCISSLLGTTMNDVETRLLQSEEQPGTKYMTAVAVNGNLVVDVRSMLGNGRYERGKWDCSQEMEREEPDGEIQMQIILGSNTQNVTKPLNEIINAHIFERCCDENALKEATMSKSATFDIYENSAQIQVYFVEHSTVHDPRWERAPRRRPPPALSPCWFVDRGDEYAAFGLATIEDWLSVKDELQPVQNLHQQKAETNAWMLISQMNAKPSLEKTKMLEGASLFEKLALQTTRVRWFFNCLIAYALRFHGNDRDAEEDNDLAPLLTMTRDKANEMVQDVVHSDVARFRNRMRSLVNKLTRCSLEYHRLYEYKEREWNLETAGRQSDRNAKVSLRYNPFTDNVVISYGDETKEKSRERVFFKIPNQEGPPTLAFDTNMRKWKYANATQEEEGAFCVDFTTFTLEQAKRDVIEQVRNKLTPDTQFVCDIYVACNLNEGHSTEVKVQVDNKKISSDESAPTCSKCDDQDSRCSTCKRARQYDSKTLEYFNVGNARTIRVLARYDDPSELPQQRQSEVACIYRNRSHWYGFGTLMKENSSDTTLVLQQRRVKLFELPRQKDSGHVPCAAYDSIMRLNFYMSTFWVAYVSQRLGILYATRSMRESISELALMKPPSSQQIGSVNNYVPFHQLAWSCHLPSSPNTVVDREVWSSKPKSVTYPMAISSCIRSVQSDVMNGRCHVCKRAVSDIYEDKLLEQSVIASLCPQLSGAVFLRKLLCVYASMIDDADSRAQIFKNLEIKDVEQGQVRIETLTNPEKTAITDALKSIISEWVETNNPRYHASSPTHGYLQRNTLALNRLRCRMMAERWCINDVIEDVNFIEEDKLREARETSIRNNYKPVSFLLETSGLICVTVQPYIGTWLNNLCIVEDQIQESFDTLFSLMNPVTTGPMYFERVSNELVNGSVVSSIMSPDGRRYEKCMHQYTLFLEQIDELKRVHDYTTKAANKATLKCRFLLDTWKAMLSIGPMQAIDEQRADEIPDDDVYHMLRLMFEASMHNGGQEHDMIFDPDNCVAEELMGMLLNGITLGDVRMATEEVRENLISKFNDDERLYLQDVSGGEGYTEKLLSQAAGDMHAVPGLIANGFSRSPDDNWRVTQSDLFVATVTRGLFELSDVEPELIKIIGEQRWGMMTGKATPSDIKKSLQDVLLKEREMMKNIEDFDKNAKRMNGMVNELLSTQKYMSSNLVNAETWTFLRSDNHAQKLIRIRFKGGDVLEWPATLSVPLDDRAGTVYLLRPPCYVKETCTTHIKSWWPTFKDQRLRNRQRAIENDIKTLRSAIEDCVDVASTLVPEHHYLMGVCPQKHKFCFYCYLSALDDHQRRAQMLSEGCEDHDIPHVRPSAFIPITKEMLCTDRKQSWIPFVGDKDGAVPRAQWFHSDKHTLLGFCCNLDHGTCKCRNSTDFVIDVNNFHDGSYSSPMDILQAHYTRYMTPQMWTDGIGMFPEVTSVVNGHVETNSETNTTTTILDNRIPQFMKEMCTPQLRMSQMMEEDMFNMRTKGDLIWKNITEEWEHLKRPVMKGDKMERMHGMRKMYEWFNSCYTTISKVGMEGLRKRLENNHVNLDVTSLISPRQTVEHWNYFLNFWAKIFENRKTPSEQVIRTGWDILEAIDMFAYNPDMIKQQMEDDYGMSPEDFEQIRQNWERLVRAGLCPAYVRKWQIERNLNSRNLRNNEHFREIMEALENYGIFEFTPLIYKQRRYGCSIQPRVIHIWADRIADVLGQSSLQSLKRAQAQVQTTAEISERASTKKWWQNSTGGGEGLNSLLDQHTSPKDGAETKASLTNLEQHIQRSRRWFDLPESFDDNDHEEDNDDESDDGLENIEEKQETSTYLTEWPVCMRPKICHRGVRKENSTHVFWEQTARENNAHARYGESGRNYFTVNPSLLDELYTNIPLEEIFSNTKENMLVQHTEAREFFYRLPFARGDSESMREMLPGKTYHHTTSPIVGKRCVLVPDHIFWTRGPSTQRVRNFEDDKRASMLQKVFFRWYLQPKTQYLATIDPDGDRDDYNFSKKKMDWLRRTEIESIGRCAGECVARMITNIDPGADGRSLLQVISPVRLMYPDDNSAIQSNLHHVAAAPTVRSAGVPSSYPLSEHPPELSIKTLTQFNPEIVTKIGLLLNTFGNYSMLDQKALTAQAVSNVLNPTNPQEFPSEYAVWPRAFADLQPNPMNYSYCKTEVERLVVKCEDWLTEQPDDDDGSPRHRLSKVRERQEESPGIVRSKRAKGPGGTGRGATGTDDERAKVQHPRDKVRARQDENPEILRKRAKGPDGTARGETDTDDERTKVRDSRPSNRARHVESSEMVQDDAGKPDQSGLRLKRGGRVGSLTGSASKHRRTGPGLEARRNETTIPTSNVVHMHESSDDEFAARSTHSNRRLAVQTAEKGSRNISAPFVRRPHAKNQRRQRDESHLLKTRPQVRVVTTRPFRPELIHNCLVECNVPDKFRSVVLCLLAARQKIRGEDALRYLHEQQAEVLATMIPEQRGLVLLAMTEQHRDMILRTMSTSKREGALQDMQKLRGNHLRPNHQAKTLVSVGNMQDPQLVLQRIKEEYSKLVGLVKWPIINVMPQYFLQDTSTSS